jgi:hypothetical protein
MWHKAITTKYIGPSNVRGARIAATGHDGRGGRMYVPYDHALSIEHNHAAAARMLAEKLEWSGDWYGGGLGSGQYVFVCVTVPHKAYAGNFTVAKVYTKQA